MATRSAQLTGGPLDGADGEVVCAPAAPDHLFMGPSGGFVYTLRGVKDGQLQYRYDQSATRRKLTDLGVPLSLRDEATRDSRSAAGAMLAGGSHEPSTTFNVTVQQYADRFELLVGDTLVEQQPREAFVNAAGETDTEGLRQWAESAVHALAQEATA